MSSLEVGRQGWLAGLVVCAVIGCGGGSQSAPPPATTTTTTTTTETPSAGGAMDAGAMPESSDAGSAAASPEAGGTETAAVELPPMPTDLHAPPHPWAQMTHQQKARWMGENVMPAMSALFRAYDPQHWGNITCATCHGDNARAVNFRMPNTLYPLPMPMTPAWQTLMQTQGRTVHFMAERVEHAQAQLLGMQPFDPATRQGFGCFGCHAHAATPATGG